MNNSPAQHILATVRQELYQTVLGLRRDALFELLEATLVAPGPATLVRLSCTPVFHRIWSSAPTPWPTARSRLTGRVP